MTETGLDAKAIGQLVGLVVSAIAAVLYGRSVLIRRMSKDGVVVATDASQVSFITTLQQERDVWAKRAEKAATELNEAMVEIGGLRAQVKHMAERIAEQHRDSLQQAVLIEALQRKVDAMTDHIASLMGLREAGVKIIRSTDGGDEP